jgi:hypothetical protein
VSGVKALEAVASELIASRGNHEASVSHVLVWLADIRPPDKTLPAERATVAVTTMLAACDRDHRLATRREERFANARTNNFPFGISLTYRKLLRTSFTE